jgi:signal transduction histidine kinase
MVRVERKRIMQMNARLRDNLFVSVGMALVLGLELVSFLRKRIIRPLREVEESTLKIAEGSFEPMNMSHADDEIQRITQAINRMVSELERRQEQLIQSEKLSSIGTLASGVAHQLNNPLNNISTSCQLLMEEDQEPDPAFTARMLQNIERETLRARDIVRGLLEFSRNHEFGVRRENLGEVVQSALQLICCQIPRSMELEWWIPEDIEVDMDRQQIQEMLLNLLINSVHATTGVGTGLSVTAESDPKRNKAYIVVEDDGCGFSEEVRGQMFDPFFTTKGVGSGTGLGLYIAYGVAHKHGGDICAEGREGIGARFVIRLPLRRPEQGKEQA